MVKKNEPDPVSQPCTLEIHADSIPIRIDPSLLLNCDGAIRVRTGCVFLIGYKEDGTPDQVQVNWLPGLEATATFPITEEWARVFERAQNHCLRVQIFYCIPDEGPVRIMRVSTLPKDGRCCPCEEDE